MERDERQEHWSEDDSRTFIDHSRFFVPDREEQIAAFCDLVAAAAGPGAPGGAPSHSSSTPSIVVELCCGEGILASALLARLPEATVYGLDGSEAMLAAARAALAGHGPRFVARPFDLAGREWRGFSFLPRAPRAVVSSLALHHLDGGGKRELFGDLHRALAPGGLLLIADLVLPATAAGAALAARAWDEAVRQRSLELASDLAAYEAFRRHRWNYFADPDPDPLDRPSTLAEQLRWLEEAGFGAVDVYWMKAGHALFGGSKSAAAGAPR